MTLKISFYLSILFWLVFAVSCDLTDLEKAGSNFFVDTSYTSIRIAKWHNNHSAAISITNDAGSVSGSGEKIVQNLVEKYGLNISYELVTDLYLKDSVRLNYLYDTYLPRGFGYFGHGHTHINHDKLSEDEAYNSFKECYNSMIKMGLKPISYAYPGGFGYHIKTQRALKRAGFLSGRKFEKLDFDNPLIMAENNNQPSNWFLLPTLVMQAYEYQYCSICINNTSELIPYLDKAIEKNAWLILTYHSIGQTEAYGYYYLDDFENDLRSIKARDFWVASMDDITLYTYQRNAATPILINKRSEFGDIVEIEMEIKHELDKSIFNIPLTVIVELPPGFESTNLRPKNGITEFKLLKKNDHSIMMSIYPNQKYTLKNML